MQVGTLIQSVWRLLATGLFSMSLVTPTLTPAAPLPTGVPQTDWSQPISLAYGWFPDIASDPYGGLHVAWSSGKVLGDTTDKSAGSVQDFDVVMYTTNPDGTRWSTPNDVAAEQSGGEVTRPAFLIDQKGILYLSYRETSILYTQAPVISSTSARSWQPPKILSDKQVAYFSRMAEDSNGVLHLVYTENVPSADCPICYHLFYRQSPDEGKTWSIRQDISKGDIGSVKPQIIVDKEDNIHVVWESGVGGSYGQLTDPTSVMYAASYDGGKTWSQPYKFPAPNSWGRNVTIGEDGEGALVVAWLGLDEDMVYYQTSMNHGKSWSGPQVIPDVWGGWTVYNARLDDYTMATDSDGNIHFVFVGRLSAEDEDLEILHLTWNGTSWSKPEVITQLKGDVPEWPRLSISLGNRLNVVWFVRQQAHIWDSDSAKYRVWFSQATIQSTAVKPNLRPTAASAVVSTPSPTPYVTPTATPMPPALAAALKAPMSDFNIYSEYDDMILMAKSLLPGVLLLGFVILLVKGRHR